MIELRRFTKEEQASFGYTVAELRQLAREHGIRGQSRALHRELVAVLKGAGIDLPRKQRPGPLGGTARELRPGRIPPCPRVQVLAG